MRLCNLLGVTCIGLAASAGMAQTCGEPWTQFVGSGPTNGAGNATMVYDSARGRVVAYFGSGSNQGTWEWDGSGAGSWTLRTTTGPGPRTKQSMAYDSTRQRTVLFGGTGLTDTWEWDGISWTQLNPAAHPGASPFNDAMAFDAARGRTVHCPRTLNQTWEWDGTNWELRGTTTANNLVYDPARSRVVGFGSVMAEWDGSTWTAFSAAIPGFISGVVAGPVPGHLLMTGGDSPIETWEYDNTADRWVWRAQQGPQSAVGLVFDGVGYLTLGIGTPNTTWRYNPGLSAGPTIQSSPSGGFALLASGSAHSLQVSASGSGTLLYQWRRNGVPLTDGGVFSGTTTPMLSLTNVGIGAAGTYNTTVTDACGSITTHTTTLLVQCYANCDGNAFLNANDFQCFLGNFAAATSYANCDGSTATPMLTANDFQCFVNAYAAGCT